VHTSTSGLLSHWYVKVNMANAKHSLPDLKACLLGPHALLSQPYLRYLDVDALIAAAKDVGADCVHPGYGFLSERPEFAAACIDNGIAFVGPVERFIFFLV
jgi:acetyl/propionyl-CoA carboxylase alpha subunit